MSEEKERRTGEQGTDAPQWPEVDQLPDADWSAWLEEDEEALSLLDFTAPQGAEEEAPQAPEPQESEAQASDSQSQKPGRRTVEKSAEEAPEEKRSLWHRAVGTASGITGRVRDWTDDLTDRFDDMAADPDNEGLVARAIRSSEYIVASLEEQQRTTEEEELEGRQRRQAAKARKNSQEPEEEEPQREPTNTVPPEELEEHTVFSFDEPMAMPEGMEIPVWKPKRERPAEEQPKAKRRREKAQPAPEQSEALEETPRETNPLSKEERRQVIRTARGIQYGLFLAVLGVIAVLGVLSPLRATTTEVEGRTLTEKPVISVYGLWKGDYFSGIEQWYSDTFPLRDALAGSYDKLGVLGFGDANPIWGTATAQSAANAEENDLNTQEEDADTQVESDLSVTPETSGVTA